MPRRREGPARSKASRYYFFDEVIGFPPNRHRIRFSLHTKDPEKARYLWEREYRKQWRKYYGEDVPEDGPGLKFQDLAEEYVTWLRDIKRIKTWRTTEDRLAIIGELWRNIITKLIGKDHFTQLDSWLRENNRSDATVNHYFKLLKAFF